MGERQIPRSALKVPLSSGKLNKMVIPALATFFRSTPNVIAGCEIALNSIEADSLLI